MGVREDGSMLGYVTIGTRNLEKAVAFYSELLELLDAKEIFNLGRLVMFGQEAGGGMLAVCTPFDGEPASSGNGNMVALNAGSREKVDAIHAKALALGATDEGAVGERMPGFYAGYFRDADGNKVAAYVMGA
jgi:catechol 2,3-dioxygenase-like lactoylglutathione lyase family enzyme